MNTVALTLLPLLAVSALAEPFSNFEGEIIEFKSNVTGHAITPLSHMSDICFEAFKTDMNENNIGSVRGARSQCCNLCKQNDNCRAYVYSDYEGGTCWLKELPGKVTFNPATTSAMVMQVPNPFYFRMTNCDMPGADISNSKSASDSGCVAWCSSNPNCKAYTWTNYNGGTCWYKSDIRECDRKAGVYTGIIFKRV